MPVTGMPVYQFTPIFHGAIVVSVKEDEARLTLLARHSAGFGVASGHCSGFRKYSTYFPQLVHRRECRQEKR